MSDINSLLDAPLPNKGKRHVAESSKPSSRVVKTTATRKRKATDVIDLEFFESHDPDQLGSLMHASVDKVIKALNDFKKKLAAAEATNEELKNHSASVADKMLRDSQELKELKKQVKSLKEDAAKHQQDLDDVTQGALASTAALVLEAKIKLAKEVLAPGFDASSWDLEAWESRLVFLRGEDVGEGGAEKDEAEKEQGKVGKEVITPGDEGNDA